MICWEYHPFSIWQNMQLLILALEMSLFGLFWLFTCHEWAKSTVKANHEQKTGRESYIAKSTKRLLWSDEYVKEKDNVKEKIIGRKQTECLRTVYMLHLSICKTQNKLFQVCATTPRGWEIFSKLNFSKISEFCIFIFQVMFNDKK